MDRNSGIGSPTSLLAAPTGCVWLSYNPGITVLPFASTTTVFAPLSFEMSALVPTATTLPPRTATASAVLNFASTVSTLPL